MTILIPGATSSTSAVKRRPAYVSSATQSVAVFAYPSSATPPPVATTLVNVGAGRPGCTSVAGGTSCTITVPAIYGSMTFVVKTYDNVLGTGNLLSQSTFTQTIGPNQAAIPVTLSGVVAATTISIPAFSVPAGGGSFAVTVNALDANGNVIVGGGTYSSPITVGYSDLANVTVSPNPVTGPGQTVTLTYGAGTASSVTLRANAAGVSINNTGQVTFSVGQPAATSATAYVFDENAQAIYGFEAGANGSPGFVTRYTYGGVPAYPPFMAVQGTRVAIAPPGYGTVFFPSGGSPLIPSIGAIEGIAYDPSVGSPVSGDLAVLQYYTTGSVNYYPPSASGTPAPSRSISGPVFVNDGNGLGIDASGNLYLASSYPPQVFMVAAGSTGSSVTASRTTSISPSSSYVERMAVAPDGTVAVELYSVTGVSTVQIYNPAGALAATLSGGPIAESYGDGMAFGSDDSLYFAHQGTVYVYAPGANGTVPPVRAFSTVQGGVNSIGAIAIASPYPTSTPAATSISGDMLALAPSKTWNYAAVAANGTKATVTVYVDPQPVDGNTGLVAFVVPTAQPDALPADGGTLAAAAGVTSTAGAYYAQTYGSVSNDSFGLIPGSPLIVPASLSYGQTFVPFPGVTATVTALQSGISGSAACPGTSPVGAGINYVVNNTAERVSFVPGCGIIRVLTDQGTTFTLQSIGSHPELGQQSVAQRTLHATYGDTLRSIWQAVLVRH
jgi:hypothetical protein